MYSFCDLKRLFEFIHISRLTGLKKSAKIKREILILNMQTYVLRQFVKVGFGFHV